jgi:hypothetical protein
MRAQNFMTARCGVILNTFKDVDPATAAEHITQLITTATFYEQSIKQLTFSRTPV